MLMKLFKLISAECTKKCLNGGECELTDNGGVCNCPEGYTGDLCEEGHFYNLKFKHWMKTLTFPNCFCLFSVQFCT